MCPFPIPLYPKEILVVAPLLFLGYIILVGIWYLARYLASADNFLIVLLVLIIPIGALYIICLSKIIIYFRKKRPFW